MSKTPYEPVQPETLDEINLLDRGLQNCPYHAYQLLRDEAPVFRNDEQRFWALSRWEDVDHAPSAVAAAPREGAVRRLTGPRGSRRIGLRALPARADWRSECG